MSKYQNLGLFLLLLIGFNSCELKKNESQLAQIIEREVSIQAFIEDFLKAFNNMDLAKIDELSASPFVFYVGGKLSKGNTYGAIVDFDAIKESGWKYTKINSTEIFYEDRNSSQVKLEFTRYNNKDEALVTSYVIWTLIKSDSNWKVKSAIILDNIALAKEE